MKDLALGIDIGGTFTDIVLYDDSSGKHYIVKQPTTPRDPAIAVAEGVGRLIEEHGIRVAEIGRVVHATTLFTNALIERKGAKTGYLTTSGFGDSLEIGLERKYDLYDLFLEMPAPLVPRDLCAEVKERTAADGTILETVDPEDVVTQVRRLVDAGVESIAICFLNSYQNPANEQAAAEAIRTQFPELFISPSNEVVREIGEYRRASTAVANAFVKPLAQQYLDGMVDRLHSLGIQAPLFLMLSSGGLTSVEEAKRFPINLLESGPAAGALAGSFFGGLNDEERVLAFDMGGTTAKACTVEDGKPVIAYDFEAAREKRFMEGSGLPLKLTTVELIEIGAGGGSKAQLDSLGLLKVGPESAGSEPGPVCYDRGGTTPTVTDADLLLGYLNPDYFLGGQMKIDLPKARKAFEPLAGEAGLDVDALAWGIFDVVNEKMASAARVHIAEKGRDPRDYTLLSTGGAGPVHAYYVAKKLGIPRLICPPSAGVGSAIGLLMAPARVDYVQTFATPLDELDWDTFERAFQDLELSARAVVEETGAIMKQAVVHRRADMRFVGQGFEIVVDLPAGPFSAAQEEQVIDSFLRTYNRLYSRNPEDARIELINVRVEVQAPISQQSIDFTSQHGEGDALKGRRPVYFPELGSHVDTQVLDRARLTVGEQYPGPAVIEEPESTLVVGPGATFSRQPEGHLVVHIAHTERNAGKELERHV